jgi:hypothetical protein
MLSSFFSYQRAILRMHIGEDVDGEGVTELAIKKVKVFLPSFLTSFAPSIATPPLYEFFPASVLC